MRAGRERLQTLSRQVVEVQEIERRHIARELHDEIGQVLTGLKLTLEMSTRLPADAARASLSEAQKLVSDLMARVRDLSLALRPAMLDDLGLLPTLLWHFERYTAQTQKEASSSDLVQAGREVAAGRRYLSPPLSERAIEAYVQKTKAAPLDRYETLTTREREVLQLAAQGSSNLEIATRLGISPRTAETHRANLMRKLGLQTQTDLVRYALRRGIIPMED